MSLTLHDAAAKKIKQRSRRKGLSQVACVYTGWGMLWFSIWFHV